MKRTLLMLLLCIFTCSLPNIVLASNSNSKNYFSVFAGILINPKIKIPINVFSGTTAESGSFEYTFKQSYKVGIEWSQFSEHSWNNGLLIDYSRMEMDEASAYGSTSGSSTLKVTDSISIINIAYAGKYRWDNFYLPVYLGLSSSNVDSSALFTKTIQAKSYAGLGIGLNIDSFSIELTSNSNAIDSSTVTASGNTVMPSMGYLNYLQLTIKFLLQ